MSEYATTEWQGTQPFYEHLAKQWEHMSNARYRINAAETIEDKMQGLEVWHESLDITFSIIVFYLDQEERDEIKKEFDKIEDITSGQEFSEAGLTPEQMYNIKHILKKLEKSLWYVQGKYEMLPKKSVSWSAGDAWKKM